MDGGWPQGKGVPSDSTTCRPSNNPSPTSPGPWALPTFPSPQHTQQPPPPSPPLPGLLHAPLHACLPLRSLGYNFAQICPLAVLHTPPSLLARETLSAQTRPVSLAHTAFLLPRSISLLSQTLACVLFPWYPPLHTSLLKISKPLLQTHLGHPFPYPLTNSVHTHLFCEHTCLYSALAHLLSHALLLTRLHTSLSISPSCSRTPTFSDSPHLSLSQ